MKGSIMDAMSDAVEGAEVVLYGVSRGYKESANCRLEANYAHQQEYGLPRLLFLQLASLLGELPPRFHLGRPRVFQFFAEPFVLLLHLHLLVDAPTL